MNNQHKKIQDGFRSPRHWTHQVSIEFTPTRKETNHSNINFFLHFLSKRVGARAYDHYLRMIHFPYYTPFEIIRGESNKHLYCTLLHNSIFIVP